MQTVVFLSLVVLVCGVLGKPLEELINDGEETSINEPVLSIKKRFVNPMFAFGDSSANGHTKMRTKRSEDQCEKLMLCKLHARSQTNFFAAFQLYFVNRENARQWDHHARTLADCEARFGDCYE